MNNNEESVIPTNRYLPWFKISDKKNPYFFTYLMATYHDIHLKDVVDIVQIEKFLDYIGVESSVLWTEHEYLPKKYILTSIANLQQGDEYEKILLMPDPEVERQLKSILPKFAQNSDLYLLSCELKIVSLNEELVSLARILLLLMTNEKPQLASWITQLKRDEEIGFVRSGVETDLKNLKFKKLDYLETIADVAFLRDSTNQTYEQEIIELLGHIKYWLDRNNNLEQNNEKFESFCRQQIPYIISYDAIHYMFIDDKKVTKSVRDRNTSWLRTLERDNLLWKSNNLIAVGGMHLAGNYSLLKLFENQNMQIEVWNSQNEWNPIDVLENKKELFNEWFKRIENDLDDHNYEEAFNEMMKGYL